MSPIFDDPLLRHVVFAVLIVVGSAVAGRLLRYLVDFLFKRFASKTETTLDDRILAVIEAKIFTLAVVAGLSLAVREIRKGLTADNITQHQILDYCSILLFVVLAVVVAHLVSRLFRTTVEWYAERVSAEKQSNIGPTIVPFTSKLANIVLFFIAGIVILDHFGVNIGGLLVSLGVGSLAVALAAQETIANMIAWFVILVDQPIRIGDRIRLSSGEEGDVTAIGLRSVRVLAPDNNLLIVPNSEVVKNRVVNLSSPDLSCAVAVDFNVAYGSDVNQVRALALGIAAAQPGIRTAPEPKLFVINLGDAALQCRLAARGDDVRRKFLVETELREALYAALGRAGIEIPAHHRILQVTHAAQAPPQK